MAQREDPGPFAEILEQRGNLGLRADACSLEPDIYGHFSGGVIHAFREGWALSGSCVAHYFRRANLTTIVSLCGWTTGVRLLFGPGNFPKCKHCKRLNTKAPF